MSQRADNPAVRTKEFVTFEVDGRPFGVEVSEVHDVFALQTLTPVPLARPHITGLLNLRGRIVTAIDARRRLGLPDRPQGWKGAMVIGVERNGESYGLLIDKVAEVLRLPDDRFDENPVNLDPRWRAISRGVYRLDGRLLVAIDIDRMIDANPAAEAA
jgi:purine-binding chemotaxis protein CheW